MKNLGALGSSADSSKLSLTVQGIFVGGATVIVAIAHYWLGISITDVDVTQFGIHVGTLVTEFLIVVGVIRKTVLAIYNWYRGL